MKKILLTLLLLAFATGAKAGGDFTGRIQSLHFYQGHVGVLVQLDHMADPDSCGRSDWFILADSHPHYKDIYAMLLAQRIGGGSIRVIVSGCVQGLPSIVHTFL
jgi:hypothetical protein